MGRGCAARTLTGMSIEYEELTMQYGCLDCEHEWTAYPKSGSELDQLCPSCSSAIVWEQYEIKDSETECMDFYYGDSSIVPDFLTK